MRNDFALIGREEAPLFINYRPYLHDLTPLREDQNMRARILMDAAARNAQRQQEIQSANLPDISGLANDRAADYDEVLTARQEMVNELSSKNPNWVVRNSPRFRDAKMKLASLLSPVQEKYRQQEEERFNEFNKMRMNYAAKGDVLDSAPAFDEQMRPMTRPDDPTDFLTIGDYMRDRPEHPAWSYRQNAKDIRPAAFMPSMQDFQDRYTKMVDTNAITQNSNEFWDTADPMTQLGMIVKRGTESATNKQQLRSGLDLARNTLDDTAKAQLFAGYIQTPEFQMQRNRFIKDGRFDTAAAYQQMLSGKDYEPSGPLARGFAKGRSLSYADMNLLNIADRSLRSSSGSKVDYSGMPGAGSGGENAGKVPYIAAIAQGFQESWDKSDKNWKNFESAAAGAGYAKVKRTVPVAYGDASSPKVGAINIEGVSFGLTGKVQSSLRKEVGLPENGDATPYGMGDGSKNVYASPASQLPSGNAFLPNGASVPRDLLNINDPSRAQIIGMHNKIQYLPSVMSPLTTDWAAVKSGEVRGLNAPKMSDGTSNAFEMPDVDRSMASSPNGFPLSSMNITYDVRVHKDVASQFTDYVPDEVKDQKGQPIYEDSEGNPATEQEYERWLRRQGDVSPRAPMGGNRFRLDGNEKTYRRKVLESGQGSVMKPVSITDSDYMERKNSMVREDPEDDDYVIVPITIERTKDLLWNQEVMVDPRYTELFPSSAPLEIAPEQQNDQINIVNDLLMNSMTAPTQSNP